jgi:hypothetical protein
MAIIHFINKEYQGFNDLRNLIKYVDRDAELIGLYNGEGDVSNADAIYQDFMRRKIAGDPTLQMKNKCLHFIQKFDRKDELSLVDAYNIATELILGVPILKSLEILFAVHNQNNMEHIHNHFVINLSNPELLVTRDDRILIRDVSDDICKKHNLVVLKPFRTYLEEKGGKGNE